MKLQKPERPKVGTCWMLRQITGVDWNRVKLVLVIVDEVGVDRRCVVHRLDGVQIGVPIGDLCRPATAAELDLEETKSRKVMSARQLVIDSFLDEREYQIQKHGTTEEHSLSVGEWLLILERKLIAAKVVWNRPYMGNPSALEFLVQIGAIALACLEGHGVDNFKRKNIGDRPGCKKRTLQEAACRMMSDPRKKKGGKKK